MFSYEYYEIFKNNILIENNSGGSFWVQQSIEDKFRDKTALKFQE